MLGQRNIPILRQALLGTMLLGRTAAVLGWPHFLESPTERGNQSLRHFGASYFSTSAAALVGVAPVGMAPAVLLSLIPLGVQVKGRYKGGFSTPRLISSGYGNRETGNPRKIKQFRARPVNQQQSIPPSNYVQLTNNPNNESIESLSCHKNILR